MSVPLEQNGEGEKMALPFPEVSGAASVSELNAMPLSPSEIHYPCSDPPRLTWCRRCAFWIRLVLTSAVDCDKILSGSMWSAVAMAV